MPRTGAREKAGIETARRDEEKLPIRGSPGAAACQSETITAVRRLREEPPGDFQSSAGEPLLRKPGAPSERGSFLSAEQITRDSDGWSHSVGLGRSTDPSVKGLVG